MKKRIKKLWEIENQEQRKWLFGMECDIRDKNDKVIGFDMDKAHELGFNNKFNSNKNKDLPECPNCNTNKFVRRFYDTSGEKGYQCCRCGLGEYEEEWFKISRKKNRIGGIA